MFICIQCSAVCRGRSVHNLLLGKLEKIKNSVSKFWVVMEYEIFYLGRVHEIPGFRDKNKMKIFMGHSYSMTPFLRFLSVMMQFVVILRLFSVQNENFFSEYYKILQSFKFCLVLKVKNPRLFNIF